MHYTPAQRDARFGRAKGGSIIGIRADARLKTSFITKCGKTIIKVENGDSNVYIVPVYINCTQWEEDFNNLVNFFDNVGESNVLLVGDVNARIGANQLMQAEFESINSEINVERKSRDCIFNARGRRLLELFSELGLVILNGRTRGDAKGEYTYISGNGASVIDIAAASLQESYNFSDHMPIVTNILIQEPESIENSLSLLPKLNWNIQNVPEFRARLEDQLSILENDLIEEEISTDHLMMTILNSVRETKTGNPPLFKNKWFDSQCYKQRKVCFRWLRKFRKTGTEFARTMYSEENRKYKIMCREKKYDYYQELSNRLGNIKNSKEWWAISKELRGKKHVIGSSITISDLRAHFQQLLMPDVNNPVIMYPEPLYEVEVLDRPIDATEVWEALGKAKNNKAPGVDRVGYEFLKNTTPRFIDKLTRAFNNIYESGEVPESFCKAIIFPIYKKGDPNDISNYRGLSFINAVAKIFISVLIGRLEEWESQHRILNESQAGFRKGYSTVDNIFNLTNIIGLAWNSGIKKVYSCFVDFKAAFDTVDRKLLIYKLFGAGVSSKYIRVLKSMYSNTKAAVWNGTRLSEYFDTLMGLRQGCPASPLLFAFYLNDLNAEIGGGLTVEDIHVRILMYADDVVLLADSPTALQKMISKLEEYCKVWALQINVNKTKVMVFQRGGRARRDERWYLGQENVEVVRAFKYLGIMLTPRLSFKQHLAEKLDCSKNSINITWSSFMKNKTVSLSVKLRLFDAVARAVMCYGGQIWGYTQYEEVEKLLRFYLKKIIGLPKCTPNYVLNLETGIPDLYVYTLKLHFRYMGNVFNKMDNSRLPKLLAKKVKEKNILWAERWNDFEVKYDMRIEESNLAAALSAIAEKEAEFLWGLKVQRARESIRHELYNTLEYNLGTGSYFQDCYSTEKIRNILKCRAGLLYLNASPWRKDGSPLCSLCNKEEEEDMKHFLAKCPILAEFRRTSFGKSELNEVEVLEYLNGKDWEILFSYVKQSLRYRSILIEEYNA